MMRRHRGYVRGRHNTLEGPVWKVRVQDPQSQFDTHKFDVAFIPEDLELVPGLGVDFTVESFDDLSLGKVSKAISLGLKTK